MKFGRYTVDIKNREKVFMPDEKITKGDIIDYYDDIADYILPFLKNRPLTMQRFPDGIREEGFYQKEVSDHFPDWIDTVKVEKKEGGTVEQVVCNNKATLIYLVNQGTVTFHPWLSKVSDLDKPDKLIFDLDPPGEDAFELVVEGAHALHDLLENELGLKTYLMTTGSKGLHVVSPIKPNLKFDDVRSFAKKAADYLSDGNSERFTTKTRKAKREGRLFLDYLRNAYGQTSVVPYSMRPHSKATIATPIEWEELSKKDLTSQSYHIKNIFKRLSQKNKVWENFQNHSRDLTSSIKKLENL